MMHRALLILLLPLAACATPQERCEKRNLKEITVIDDLIATTAGNIERGYAIENKAQPNFGMVFCTNPGSHVSFCTSSNQSTKRTPSAIDIAAERRKLRELKAKRVQLHSGSQANVAACVEKRSN